MQNDPAREQITAAAALSRLALVATDTGPFTGHSPICAREAAAILNEIEYLRLVIAWCRPRLRTGEYRTRLDQYLLAPRGVPDHTPITQSAENAE